MPTKPPEPDEQTQPADPVHDGDPAWAQAASPSSARPAPAEPTLTWPRRSRLGMLVDLAWMVADAARAWPAIVLITGGIAAARGLLVPAQLWLTKLLVDALAAALRGGGPAGGRGSALEPRWETWIALLAASVLADRALAGVQGWLGIVGNERLGPMAQERTMARAAQLHLVAFEHQAYYDRLKRVLPDAGTRVPDVIRQVLQLAQGVPSFLGYAVSLAFLSPLLAAVVLVATVPTVVAWTVLGQVGWGVTAEVTRERRLAEYYAGLLTDRACAKEVRLYGMAEHLLRRWSEHYWGAERRWRRQYQRSGNVLRAATAGSVATNMLALWLVATRLLPHASAGTLTLLFQGVEGLFGATFGLGNSLNALGEQSGYASELRAFLRGAPTLPGHDDAGASAGVSRATSPSLVAPAVSAGPGMAAAPPASPVEVTERVSPRPDGPTLARGLPFPSPLRDAIRFEDVWFTYPGADAPALAGLSLEIPAGERVALVGANGAGKTTLAKLLLGLYPPDAGRITVDGTDAARLHPDEYRAAVSAVFQRFVRYPLTFRENVGLGHPAAMDDAPRLHHAVARSGADEVVADLDAGFATLLGPDVGGTDLSGGQWQRLALARAFFRTPPPSGGPDFRGSGASEPTGSDAAAQVLVLDEPTAALDPLAELAVFERFADLAADCTAVLVSHRLAMARLADRVAVMRGGRVVEFGPHDALYRAGGEYAAMFDAQARWYR